jgi:hypothetical protein
MVLFKIQEKLLQELCCDSKSFTAIIKLSLLQTLPPVADYIAAINILKELQTVSVPFEYRIIGAQLASMWEFDTDNEFLQKLLSCKTLNHEQLSMVWYVHALEQQKLGQDIKKSLYRSVQECCEHVNNYLLLSQQEHNLRKWGYLKLAKKNVKLVLATSELACKDVSFFIQPSLYIEEKIMGTTLSESLYNEVFSALQL